MTGNHIPADALILYAAGRASEDVRAKVEAHLARCAICRDELAQWRAISGVLAEPEAQLIPDTLGERGWAALLPSLAGRSAIPEGELLRESLDTGLPLPKSTSPNGRFPMISPDSTIPPAKKPLRAIGIAVSAVLIIAIAFAVAVVHGRQLPGGRRVGPPPLLPPEQWIQTLPPPAHTGLPDGTSLNDLVMVSSDEGWAVGVTQAFDKSKLGQQDEVQFIGGLMMHFKNGQWLPVPGIPSDLRVSTLTMFSATDGWAFAYQSGVPDSNGTVLHYSGGQWQAATPPVPLPSLGQGPVHISRMWKLNANDIWFCGWSSNPNDKTAPSLYATWRYDGHTEQKVMDSACPQVLVPVPDAGPGAALLATIQEHASSQSVTPTVSISQQGLPLTIISVYQAGTLMPQLTLDSGILFDRFTVISSTDIWASGTDTNMQIGDADYGRPPALYHYDGTQWSRADLGVPKGVSQMVMTGHDEGLAFASGSVMDKTGWGTNEEITAMYHYRGGVWTKLKIPLTLRSLSSFAVLSPDDVWAIGNYDVSWLLQHKDTTLTGAGYGGSVLMHYSNGQWVQYTGQ